MYSAYKLNKQGDNIQLWRTPFPICNQFAVPCPVLTVASWPAYRFLKRQVRCSGILISFRSFHSWLWSTQSKAFSSVWFSHSVVSDYLRSHESQQARSPCPSPSRSSLRLTSIKSLMPSSHLILSRPLLLLPPIPPSIRVFSNKSTLHVRWPKYWSFSFSIILSKEIPELISFRMDWLDLLAVQGTLKSLLQHHRSKASILRHSAFLLYSPGNSTQCSVVTQIGRKPMEEGI